MKEISAYSEWYFEKKYKYSKKKEAVQRHYLNILSWADRNMEGRVLNGKGKRALDVGCAYGFVVELLSRIGYDAVGVDISSYAVRRGRKAGLLLEADAGHLPFAGNTFDLVTCFAVLEHLLNLEKALREIARVMKPGGIIVVTTPNINVVAKVLIHVLAREPTETHPSARLPGEWIKTLTNFGFGDVKAKHFLLLPIPPRLFQRYFTVGAHFTLASHIGIVAVKNGGGDWSA
ncbi:MAG: class I SAM-dependent methyltransferase [Candidatus Jordarchaeales archaeon]